MTEWNKELEKRILRKSRFTLTFRILRILLLVFFIYGGYMIAINLIADKSNIAKETAFHSKLALEWTVPNVRGDFNFEEEEYDDFRNEKIII